MSKRDDYWRRLIASHEASGLSRAEFCRRRGVNYQTMSAWVRRFKNTDGDTMARRLRETGYGGNAVTPPEFSNHRVTAQAESNHPKPEAGHARAAFVEVSLPAATEPKSYDVVLGNHRLIRLGADFDDNVLARLIRTVESC